MKFDEAFSDSSDEECNNSRIKRNDYCNDDILSLFSTESKKKKINFNLKENKFGEEEFDFPDPNKIKIDNQDEIEISENLFETETEKNYQRFNFHAPAANYDYTSRFSTNDETQFIKNSNNIFKGNLI